MAQVNQDEYDIEDMLEILSGNTSSKNQASCAIDKGKGNLTSLMMDMVKDDGAATKINPANNETAKLELELRKMEARMEQMRQELALKKQGEKQNQTSTGGQPFGKQLKEIDLGIMFSSPEITPVSQKSVSAESQVHKGDTDSSDDEDNRNPLDPYYNDFGKFVKKRLAHTPTSSSIVSSASKCHKVLENKTQSWKQKSASSSSSKTPSDSYVEPFSGIRICNPKLSSQLMKARMEGRQMVQMSTLKNKRKGCAFDSDWVTIGVVVFKSPAKTSQKGKTYSIWRLSDLRDCTFTVSFFLFGSLHQQHWKISVGTIIGLLNPKFMGDNFDNGYNGNGTDVSLTLDHHEKLLEIGTAKDLGWCKARRRDGQNCNSFVNVGVCNFCTYHLKSEYKRLGSARMELQGVSVSAGNKGKGRGKNSLRERMAANLPPGSILARPSEKLLAKDQGRLSSLGLEQKADALLADMGRQSAAKKQKIEANNAFQEQLKIPTAGSRNFLQSIKKAEVKEVAAPKVMSITAKQLLNLHMQKIEKIKNEQRNTGADTSEPCLGKGINPGGHVDLEITKKQKRTSLDAAKLKALHILRSKGDSRPLQREDPNAVRSKKRKQLLEEQEAKAGEGKDDAKSDFLSQDFLKLLEMGSSHQDLAKHCEQVVLEQHLDNLEQKEAIEAKMAATFQVPTKAVCCLKCQYRAFSATQRCRDEGHPLKVVNTVKRFFKCHDCGNRTVALDRLPKHACQQCGSSSWEKAPMMKERKGPLLDSEKLSLCGNDGNLLVDVPGNSAVSK